MCLVIFDSKTNNVKRFSEKLKRDHPELEIVRLTDNGIPVPGKPFHLITYTTGIGEVPATTLSFLEKYHDRLLSVTVSGNRNWGPRFGLAGDIISEMYRVPLLMKFELSGTHNDVNNFFKEIKSYAQAY